MVILFLLFQVSAIIAEGSLGRIDKLEFSTRLSSPARFPQGTLSFYGFNLVFGEEEPRHV